MATQFDTSEFFRSHMREPRGRGSWAFSMERDPDVTERNSVKLSPSMTYQEAKKWAKSQFPKDAEVYVMP